MLFDVIIFELPNVVIPSWQDFFSFQISEHDNRVVFLYYLKETKQARLWLFVFLENDIQNSSFSLAVWKEHRFKMDGEV